MRHNLGRSRKAVLPWRRFGLDVVGSFDENRMNLVAAELIM